MGAEIKGYLVRAKDGAGNMAGSSTRSTLGGAARALDVLAATGCTDVAIFRVLDDGREERLPSYEEALERLSAPDRVRSYLAELCAWPPGEVPPDEELLDAAERLFCADKGDPLAALEAAERRLLEAGGWHLCSASAEFGAERWRRGSAPDAHESRTVALTIERRRLAAKGGA